MKRRTFFNGASGPRTSSRTGSGLARLRGVHGVALPAALVAGLLGTSPAAAEDSGEQRYYASSRSLAVEYWKSGGAGVKEAAERALLGSDADIRNFLDGKDAIQYDDDYVDASRIFNVGGPAVRSAARQALKGTPTDLRKFLRSGWQGPLAEDRQVEASQVINLGGAGVKEAGKAALKGTPADVVKFLDSGQFEAREADNEVAVSKLVSTGGPNVKAAAKVALRGTPDDMVEFL
jgi:hypothetical protein